jgi:hypothetical protein
MYVIFVSITFDFDVGSEYNCILGFLGVFFHNDCTNGDRNAEWQFRRSRNPQAELLLAFVAAAVIKEATLSVIDVLDF